MKLVLLTLLLIQIIIIFGLGKWVFGIYDRWKCVRVHNSINV